MATVTATAENFDQIVRENDFVLVDFWAAWCGPCRAFAPVFEQASESNSDLVFAKVDTEAEAELSARAGITAIPTLMVFRDGVLLYREPGALPAQALDQLIKAVRDVDMDEVRAKLDAQAEERSA